MLFWTDHLEPPGQRSLVTEYCRIKQCLQTMSSLSPNYFWQTTNLTKWEEILQTWADEVDYEVVQLSSVSEGGLARLTVTYPFVFNPL